MATSISRTTTTDTTAGVSPPPQASPIKSSPIKRDLSQSFSDILKVGSQRTYASTPWSMELVETAPMILMRKAIGAAYLMSGATHGLWLVGYMLVYCLILGHRLDSQSPGEGDGMLIFFIFTVATIFFTCSGYWFWNRLAKDRESMSKQMSLWFLMPIGVGLVFGQLVFTAIHGFSDGKYLGAAMFLLWWLCQFGSMFPAIGYLFIFHIQCSTLEEMFDFGPPITAARMRKALDESDCIFPGEDVPKWQRTARSKELGGI